MTITNGYLTTEEARTYVGLNQSANTEDVLDDVVTSVSRLIDRHTGRHFYQQTATARTFDTEDGYCVKFGPFNDLVSVTTVKVDANEDGAFETTLSGSAFQLLNLQGKVPPSAPVQWPSEQLVMLGGQTLPYLSTTGRRGLIEITGTWGWPAVPAEVKQACRIIVAEVFKLKEAPLGVAGFNEFGSLRVGSRLPARAVDLLAPYRHPLNFGISR